MDTARGIGHMNDLAWRGKVPADMKRFRELTTGHPIIMGRKTYESVGRALPNRRNIVISRTAGFVAKDIEVFTAPEDALANLNKSGVDEVFIIGGSQIFAELLPKVNRMYLTYIESQFPADTYFPEIQSEDWSVSSDTRYAPDEKNLFPLRFVTLERNISG